jgi:hypothetical protein
MGPTMVFASYPAGVDPTSFPTEDLSLDEVLGAHHSCSQNFASRKLAKGRVEHDFGGHFVTHHPIRHLPKLESVG